MINKRHRTREILANTPKNHGKLIDATAIFEKLVYANAVRHMRDCTTKKKPKASIIAIKGD